MKFLRIRALMSALMVGFAACDGGTGGDPTPPEAPEIPADISKYDNYYMSGGQKIELTKTDDVSYVLFDNSDTQVVMDKLTALGAEIEDVRHLGMSGFENPDGHFLNCSCAVVIANHDDVSKIAELMYVTPFYKDATGRQAGVSPYIMVTLKKEYGLAKLKKLAEDNRMFSLGQLKYDTGQYVLACTKESTGHSLQIANWLYELELFEKVYADIFDKVVPAQL